MNKEQRLEKLLKLKSDSELAIFDAVNDLEDKFDQTTEEIKQSFQEKVSDLKATLPDLDRVLSSIKGAKGDKGEAGDVGPMGPEGPRGFEGAMGPTGLQGPAGRDGKDGMDGLDGLDGRDGKDGEKGDVGPMPKHEWTGTKIRFELPGGKWGKEVDLIGPSGQPGLVERIFGQNGSINIALKNAGSLVTTKINSLNFAGSAISSITNSDGNVTVTIEGGEGGGAPTTSKYILQTADASLPNAQDLGSLATGILKSTTTTGVLSIAVAGTDYLAPNGSGAGLSGIVTSATGTANQVNVSANTGAVTFSLPQDIHSGASPTFAGLLLSGLTASRVLTTDGSKNLASSSVTVTELGYLAGVTSAIQTQIDSKQATLPSQVGNNGKYLTTDGANLSWGTVSSGGAPTDATYVTLSTNGTLTNERVLTGTSNRVTITDNGAGSTVVLSTPQDIHTAATPTFSGMTLSGLTSGSVPYLTTGGQFTQDTTNLIWNSTSKYLSTGSRIIFPASGSAVTGAEYSLGRDATATNQLVLNVPSSTAFVISQNGTARLTLSTGAAWTFATAVTCSSTLTVQAGMNVAVGSNHTYGTVITNAMMSFNASATTRIPVAIRAAASQTANLFQIQTSADVNTFVVDSNGRLLMTPAVSTSGTPSTVSITPGNNTGLTTTAEVSQFIFAASTQTWAAGTIALQRYVKFGAPTYAFASSSTITDAINADFADCIAGTNATLTRQYSVRTGDIFMNGGQRWKRVAVTTTYSVLATDLYLGITAASPYTITLPSAVTVGAGKVYVLADEDGSTSTQTVTVDCTGGQTIDGSSTLSIDGGQYFIISNGSNWIIISGQ